MLVELIDVSMTKLTATVLFAFRSENWRAVDGEH